MVEIIEVSDIKDYEGIAEIPNETLLQRVEKLQKEQQKATRPNYNYETDGDLSATGKSFFRVLDISMYVIPLLAVHLCLNILVRMQYGQDVTTGLIAKETVQSVPVLILVHYMLHPYRKNVVFRILSMIASTAIGMYLVYSTNEEGYYAVMKRAPALGTLWVWLFLEMEWNWAAMSLVGVGAYMWLNDYKF